MSFETNVDNGIPSNEAIDDRWADRLGELLISAFELLDGEAETRAKEKAQFLADEKENPQLDYPQLKEFPFDETEAALMNLKMDIMREEENPLLIEIYRTKINEVLAEVRMLKMARDGDDGNFFAYSKFVYGKPSAENVSVMSDILRNKVSQGYEDKNKTEAIDELTDLLKVIPSGEYEPSRLVEGAGLKGRVSSAEEVESAFREALDEIGATDWKVVTHNNSSITNLRVSQKNKEVSVPLDQASRMLNRLLQGFIQHEVFGHVKRRVEGERSTLKLLGYGLDRVEKGEEGVATYLEQQVTGAEHFAHPQRYFAIALAMGEVDGVKRDFRQTFEVLKQYYISTLKSGDDLEARAIDSAWTLAVRVFRGTTCTTPGAVFTKDLNYFVGNKETWALVNTDSSVVQYFSIGKFDAFNDRHIGWLVQLGITDEKLSEILNATK